MRCGSWGCFVSAAIVAASVLGCEQKAAQTKAPAASAQSSVAAVTPLPSTPTPGAPATSARQERRSPPEKVACQHVLVAYRGAKRAPRSITRSKSAARKRAAEVLEKARRGTDFSELAREYSDDPSGKLNRGNLGLFKRDAMAKKFSDAAFALKVGEVSEVVETAFGLHIIKRNQ